MNIHLIGDGEKKESKTFTVVQIANIRQGSVMEKIKKLTQILVLCLALHKYG